MAQNLNMTNRRNFLKFSAMGSFSAVAAANMGMLSGLTIQPGSVVVKDQPIVISTWGFGQQANAAAWEILKNGGRALDAVEAGVKIPEADPENQSVGLGGRPDRDGHVTLDACIMDENYRCGAVLCMEEVVHAISVARLVMEKTPHVMLAGDGALQFALANGFKRENLLTPKSEKEWREWLKTANYQPVMNIEDQYRPGPAGEKPGSIKNHDTVGMLAMDSNGNLSGACSTSGMAYKIRGRVGDSPIIGAGLYVDNEVGSATSSGVGEEVVRIAGSHTVVEMMRQGYPPEEACKEAVMRIKKCNPNTAEKIQVGFLAMNKKGEYGAYALQKDFSFAVRNNGIDTVYPSKYFYH